MPKWEPLELEKLLLLLLLILKTSWCECLKFDTWKQTRKETRWWHKGPTIK